MKNQIQHFVHRHPLFLVKEKVESYHRCKICKESLSSYPCYGCLQCRVFLHPTCCEIPEKIQHFLHPCSESLTFFIPAGNRIRDGCSLCGQTGNKEPSGACYCCSKCKFQTHRFCSQVPEEIQHHLHPCTLTSTPSKQTSFCNACFEDKIHKQKYGCDRCGFSLHHECALLPSTASVENEEEILHFTHRHPLRLMEMSEKKNCSICRQPCSDLTYCCKDCNFFLHQSCLNELKQTIQHPLHPEHSLILQTSEKSSCSWCGRYVERDFVYRCGPCNFNLDVICATTSIATWEDALGITHFYHKHPLEVLHHQNTKHGYQEARCWACREYSPRPELCCYKCNFFLHLSCASNSSPQTLRLEDDLFHQDHNLQIRYYTNQERVKFCCIACGLDNVEGDFLAYFCMDCPELVMHVGCAQLRPSIRYGKHKHLLTFFNKRGDPGPCLICREPCKKFFLRCVICRISLHLQCHPWATKTVKHKYHRHLLTLTKSPLGYDLEEFGKLDEYYCDFCEEPRPASDPVYSCKNPECMISTEVGCVFSTVFDSLTAKIRDNGNGEGSSRKIDPVAKELESKIILRSSDYRKNIKGRNKAREEIESLKRRIDKFISENHELSKEIKELMVQRFSHFASNPETF